MNLFSVDKFTILSDFWLDSLPDKAIPHAYQTDLSEMMLEHISALNLVINTSAMWIHPNGNRSNVAVNVFTFAHKLVDKIWKKQLSKLDKPVAVFLFQSLEAVLKHHDAQSK